MATQTNPDPGPAPNPDLEPMVAPTPPLSPADYRDPREEVTPGEPRRGNMPSNETFTQLGDYPERLAREEVKRDPLTGFPIRTDVPPDPNHGPHSGMTDAPEPEQIPDHPEKSELSDPAAEFKHHGDEDPELDNTPVAGTDLTGEEAEEIVKREASAATGDNG